jgi:adenylosuccinate lyase
VAAELPFMATEEILMAATAGGRSAKGKRAATGDRQDLHEIIRRHSQAAAMEVKMHGRPNDLLARLQEDPAFANVDFRKALDAKRFIGLAPQQVDSFLKEVVGPITRRHKSALGKSVSLSV